MAGAGTVSVRRREDAAVDSQSAAEVKTLLARGDRIAAGRCFAAIIERHQRRATRIAYYYLRDAAEVDEAVQDAFLKSFTHLPSFREHVCFEIWFTRILVNGCLDRLKSRARWRRRFVPTSDTEPEQRDQIDRRPALAASPETALLRSERRNALLAAIDHLPARQRAVIVLSQLEGHATREVATLLDLREATVRVHLFRAIRGLRKLLRGTHRSPRRRSQRHTGEARCG
jgi:RNA polymerase sigma-70 factor (ECF subfamily)